MSDEEDDFRDDGDGEAAATGVEEPSIDEKGYPVVTARKLQQQLNPMQLRMEELKRKKEVSYAGGGACTRACGHE